MARLFGTDGVRGLANGDVLTPELAIAVAAAAGGRLLGAARPRAAARWPSSVATPASGAMLEAAVGRRLRQRRRATSLRVGVVPTPGGRAPAPASCGADLGRDDLAPRTTRCPTTGSSCSPPAGTSCPTPSRTRSRPTSVRATPRRGPPATTSAGSRDVRRRARALRRPPARPRRRPLAGLHVVVDCAQGAASRPAPEAYRRGRCRGDRDRTPTPTAATSTTACGATHLGRPAGARSCEHGADLGHRPRRRRRPVPRRRRPTAPSSTATRSWRCSRSPCTSAASCPADTLVATVMSNLGLHLAMADAGDRGADDGGRRPLRPRGDARRRATRSAASSPATSCCSTTPPPATACSRPCGSWRAWRDTGRPLADLAAVMTRLPQVLVNVPVADKAAVGASTRGGSTRSPPPRPSSAAGAGCCCAPRAPSSSCA